MKIKIFNYKDYSNYEMLEESVNKFLSNATLYVTDVKTIRLSNNPSTDSIIIIFKDKE